MNNLSRVLTLMLFCLLSVMACNKDNNLSPTQKLNNDDTSSNIRLKFLDEYVYSANTIFKNTKIGGLSGIDYSNGSYYIVTDDFKKPRYYKANICIKNKKISDVFFTDVVLFDKRKDYYKGHFLDLESIVFQNRKVIISSEGSIYGNKKPSVFTSDTQGNYISEYALPNKFVNSSRHNGAFESLTKSIDNKGIWVANELPLTVDGTEPKHKKTHSPLRFTYYDNNNQKAIKEYVYELSALPLTTQKDSDINGVSDILEYKTNQFLVIERAFQGRNIIKIFIATIESNTTNSLKIKELSNTTYIPMKKELIFDFDSIKSKLTKQKIDNIEGITFGESLPNGSRTIIMISDDNFQKFGSQLNQFILFELIETNHM